MNTSNDPIQESLTRLQPRPTSALDDRFFFEAGRASRDHALKFWRYATITSTVLAFGIGSGLLFLLLEGKRDSQRELTALRHRLDDLNQTPTTTAAPDPTVDPVPAVVVPTEKQPRESLPKPTPVPLIPWQPPSQPSQVTTPSIARNNDSEHETAEALRIRREILLAGVNIIPEHRPTVPPRMTPSPSDLQLPPGVFASPFSPLNQKPEKQPMPEEQLP